MNDTPRTDALLAELKDAGTGQWIDDLAYLARQLERELRAATAQLRLADADLAEARAYDDDTDVVLESAARDIKNASRQLHQLHDAFRGWITVRKESRNA